MSDIECIIASGLPPEEAPVVRTQIRYGLDADQVAALRKIARGEWRYAEIAEAWFEWRRPDLAGIPAGLWYYRYLREKIAIIHVGPLDADMQWRSIFQSLDEWEYVEKMTLLPSGNLVMLIGDDCSSAGRAATCYHLAP